MPFKSLDSNLFNGFYKNKRVFITGHTGFKGAWLSIWLDKLGANVTGYALPPPTNPSLFKRCHLDKKYTSIIGDIRDIKNLKNFFLKYQPEIVFHLAAQSLVRPSYKDPRETYEINVMGTVNLLEACRSTESVRSIVNITSDKCYENHESVCGYRECDPMGGFDPYSSSKGCAELVTAAFIKSFFNHKSSKISLCSARAGNVIGGGDWACDRLVPDCVKALIKNKRIIIRYPDAIRPWQHVLEPLYGYLLLGERLYKDGKAYTGSWNFGPSDEDVKPVKWLVEHIIDLWKNNKSWIISQNDEPHESHSLKLDCSKSKAELNWYPQWNLQQTLKNTVEWYKAYINKEDMFKYTVSQIEIYERDLVNGKNTL